MLEFKDEVLQFKYNDEICEVRFPSALDMRDYRKNFNKDEAEEFMIDFLIKLGLQDHVAKKLSHKKIMHLFKLLKEDGEEEEKK